MFSVITNIYNKKTKGPTIMELFTATGKLKRFFFLQLEMFDVCTTGDTAHIDTISKFLPHTHTHTSTWVHRCSSLLQWSVPLGQRGHVAMVGRILFTKRTLHSNHRLTRVILQHTKRLLPRSGRNVKYDEKQLTGEKKNWVVPSICTCFVNTCRTVFPIINFCNPGLHYETPCAVTTRSRSFNGKLLDPSAGLEIPANLWNPHVHCRAHNSQPLIPIPSQYMHIYLEKLV